ncbi:hypothetical protein B0H16DRAFT_666432 [Mycena metata]|uniref:Uncharacterized protein n=1 Tax=Mycena metata TaxID=1033252 RepID=A0AAD7NEP1_9AGAR|nr:hypothetical protein B0H16DRAFT_666432 [Mycena metata]
MEGGTPKEVLAINGPMPLLRHLDLSLKVVMTEDNALVVFEDAPLLRTVLVGFAAARLALPWAQLTSLTLNEVSYADCVSILRLASNLVDCDLVGVSFHSAPAAPDVTLARLESLNLKVRTFRGANLLGGALILPALRRLTVGEWVTNAALVPPLAAFIAQAGCTRLEEVCIADTYLVSEQELRAAFPSILTFTFVAQPTLINVSSPFFY